MKHRILKIMAMSLMSMSAVALTSCDLLDGIINPDSTVDKPTSTKTTTSQTATVNLYINGMSSTIKVDANKPFNPTDYITEEYQNAIEGWYMDPSCVTKATTMVINGATYYAKLKTGVLSISDTGSITKNFCTFTGINYRGTKTKDIACFYTNQKPQKNSHNIKMRGVGYTLYLNYDIETRIKSVDGLVGEAFKGDKNDDYYMKLDTKGYWVYKSGTAKCTIIYDSGHINESDSIEFNEKSLNEFSEVLDNDSNWSAKEKTTTETEIKFENGLHVTLNSEFAVSYEGTWVIDTYKGTATGVSSSCKETISIDKYSDSRGIEIYAKDYAVNLAQTTPNISTLTCDFWKPTKDQYGYYGTVGGVYDPIDGDYTSIIKF